MRPSAVSIIQLFSSLVPKPLDQWLKVDSSLQLFDLALVEVGFLLQLSVSIVEFPLILNIDVIAFVNLAYLPLQWLIFPVALSIWSPSLQLNSDCSWRPPGLHFWTQWPRVYVVSPQAQTLNN